MRKVCSQAGNQQNQNTDFYQNEMRFILRASKQMEVHIMKAVMQTSYDGIDALRIIETPSPHGQLMSTLVNVHFVPVLPWDVKSEMGLLPNGHADHLPKIPGYGFSGIVNASHLLGPAVGTRVVGATPTGSYAEIVNAPIPLYLFTLPDEVSLADAATIFGGADTAMMILNSVRLKATDHVLLIGASGGVGDYLAQLLTSRGIAFTILSSQRSLAYTRQTFVDADIHSTVEELANETFDYVLDTSGDVTTLGKIERTLKTNGVLFTSALPNYQPHRQDIRSQFNNNPIPPKQYQTIIHMLATGQLVVHIDHIFSMQDVKTAQQRLLQSPSRGRVLLSINESTS